jgi:hypothetical protein
MCKAAEQVQKETTNPCLSYQHAISPFLVSREFWGNWQVVVEASQMTAVHSHIVLFHVLLWLLFPFVAL